MFVTLLQTVTLVAFIAPTPLPGASLLNEPWIARYNGNVSREREMAEMDNFAIQILNDPNLIGYILIYSGWDSCRGEAQARALRIRKYLMNVRRVPWNRVMWKNGGRYRDEGLEIFFLGFDRNVVRIPDFPFEPPPTGHVIPECRSKRARR